jgi:hypothetical protein
MKVFLFATLFVGLVLMQIELKAQGFGVRAGYQTASTTNNGGQIDGALGHIYLGAYKNIKLGLGDLLRINTGLEYMQNGHRKNEDNFRSINYLSIPLALRAKLGPLYAQGGMNANFKVGEKYEVNSQSVLKDTNKTSSFDAPLHIGVGFRLLIIDIEARYHRSFMDVNNGNNNSYLQIGAAFGF